MSSSLGPSDAVNVFVSNLQKKHRNLVKRKAKLDHYREMLNKGEPLNDEQKKAVEGYEGVLQSITVVQEVIGQTKELVDDVELAVKQSNKQFEQSIEENMVKFLRTEVCLMQIINALDMNDLRTAIIKSSSANHLRMLDIVKDLLTAPIVTDWPGMSAASLSSAPEFVQTQPGYCDSAQHLYNLVLGRSVPIPVPDDFEGSLRKFNFKEARSLCFRLLATPVIQRLLGAPVHTSCASSTASEEAKSAVDSGHMIDAYNSRQDYFPTDIQDLAQDHVPIPGSFEPTVQQRPPAQNVVHQAFDGPTKPICSSFNFLQASKVMSSDQPHGFSTGQAESELNHQLPATPMMDPPMDSRVELEPPAPSLREFIEVTESTYTTQPTSFDDTHSVNYAHPVEPATHSIPSSDVAELETVSSKPACYADLFRRQGRGNHLSGHRGMNATSSRKTEHVVATSGDSGESEELEHGAQRGPGVRTRGSDYRGGRGYAPRGFSRGYSNGPVRRPYGGQRVGGRGATAGPGNGGRGRATAQGPRANMAQA